MYICLNCGDTFEEPETYSENMGEFWGTPAYEEFSVCPCCHEGAMTELDDDSQEIYQLGYDKGKDESKSAILQRFKLAQGFIKPDMTVEQTVKLIGEWLNEKSIAKLVGKYSN